jgi:NTE family protein
MMTGQNKRERPQRVAVVLAGAGARGAYEAGALSVVLPRLEQDDIRPDLYIGTSAGAINACLFAANAHLVAKEQAENVLEVWRGIELGDVFRPVLRAAIGTALSWTGQFVGWPGARLTGLLDTAPLRATADRVLDWTQLRANLDAGTPRYLAVTATSGRTGRSAVFVDGPTGSSDLPREDTRPIDYVSTRIEGEHVLASSAIPVLFPPVEVTEPEAFRDWYSDGGLRLNAPLKPAVALGADALVVVATHPAEFPDSERRSGPQAPPDVDDTLVQLLDAALADPLVEDVRTLMKVNTCDGAGRSATGRVFREIPFLFLGPRERGSLAQQAQTAYAERFGTIRGALRHLTNPDLPVIAAFLAGDGDRRGDILSYVQFDRGFIDRAIDLGKADAERALRSPGGAVPWRTTSLPGSLQ